ncbi:hypothetical protein OIU78_025540 [Salix suchowensis]|nr:hypothetical protein OIU78_025540 [Salix suchowensis]
MPSDEGKVGILYKASLPNGYVLAVKKLHAFRFLEEQFISEFEDTWNFQPKLSNFGEAMLMSSTCTSSVNSELWEMAFVKEDVHGFGVVLLELITRVDPRNMSDSSNNILDEWVDHLLSDSSSSRRHRQVSIGRGFDARDLSVA